MGACGHLSVTLNDHLEYELCQAGLKLISSIIMFDNLARPRTRTEVSAQSYNSQGYSSLFGQYSHSRINLYEAK